MSAQPDRFAPHPALPERYVPVSPLKAGENRLQSAVLALVRERRLLWFHDFPHPQNRNPAGWFDLVICGPKGVIFRELKSRDGRMRSEQVTWVNAFKALRQDAAVWRPEDWESGRIQREISALGRWVSDKETAS